MRWDNLTGCLNFTVVNNQCFADYGTIPIAKFRGTKEDLKECLAVFNSETKKVDIFVKLKEKAEKVFCFNSLDEYQAFKDNPFDPLFRGFYPLKSKKNGHYLLDVGKLMKASENTIFIDYSYLIGLAVAITDVYSAPASFKQVGKMLLNEFLKKEIIKNGAVNLYFNDTRVLKIMGTLAEVFVIEDEHAKYLCIYPLTFSKFVGSTLARYFNVRTQDILVTLNEKSFLFFKHTAKKGYYCQYSDTFYPNSAIVCKPIEDLINIVIMPCVEHRGDDVAKKNNVACYFKGIKLSSDYELLNSTVVNKPLNVLKYLDYTAYDCEKKRFQNNSLV